MAAEHDTAVVGAGIVGLAVARELLQRRPGRRLVVIDRAAHVGAEQSSHNSGVIHAGVYYAPGSLKARLCVEGVARLYEYCQRREVAAERIGKLIIATGRRELPGLDELERRARANGVPGIERLGAEGIAELEPQATGVAALHSPGTGIVDFQAVCRRLAEDVQAAGGEVRLGWPVGGIDARPRTVRLHGPDGDALEAGTAIFCAGAGADRLAVMAGGAPDPRIVPFRGAYRRLRPGRDRLVRRLIYPVPDPALPFLGVHLTPTLAGDVLVGPTALLLPTAHALSWPGTWRMAACWWRTGLSEIRYALSRRAFAEELSRYVPAVTAEDLEPALAGVRAQAVARDGRLLDDFAISLTPRALHVRNAPSPAATSALALAAHIVDLAERELGR